MNSMPTWVLQAGRIGSSATIVLDDTDERVRNYRGAEPGPPRVSGPHPGAPRSAAALMAGGISSAIEHQRWEILSRLTCTSRKPLVRLSSAAPPIPLSSSGSEP